MSEQVVFCKDCKHSFRSWKEILFGYAPLRCRKILRPAGVKIDPVAGTKKHKAFYETCNIERSWSSENYLCGKNGKLWEPKDKKNFFIYLKRV